MLRKTFAALALSCMISVGSQKQFAIAQEGGPRIVGEVLTSALADRGQATQLRAFDVAPDGNAVAVLYATWTASQPSTGAELWVALWDISSNMLAWKQRIGTDTSSGAERVRNANDLIFTADESRLVALAVKRVWCLDAKKGGEPVSISPPDHVSGVPAQVRALRGTTVAITYGQSEGESFDTQLIDVSSKDKMSGWTSSAAPQSFSADGKLAIAVIPGYGAADLVVIDSTTGAKLRTVPVASVKRHPHDGVFAVAKFLDGTYVVVSSNHRIDRSEKHAAYSLEFIDASNGQLIREITPEYFRPGGQIVVAPNRNRFAVESVYARERDLLWDSPRPRDLRVNLFVFSRNGTTPEATIPNVYASLPGGKGEPLRLSSDGSVLAVSESPSGSIKIFQIKVP
jgi:hypothetical protein